MSSYFLNSYKLTSDMVSEVRTWEDKYLYTISISFAWRQLGTRFKNLISSRIDMGDWVQIWSQFRVSTKMEEWQLAVIFWSRHLGHHFELWNMKRVFCVHGKWEVEVFCDNRYYGFCFVRYKRHSAWYCQVVLEGYVGMVFQTGAWVWNKALLGAWGQIFGVRVIGEGSNKVNYQEVAESGSAVYCWDLSVILSNPLVLIMFVIFL